LGFEGISDRNAIEKYRDVLLYSQVDINEPGVDEDDYHVLQLIGCQAFTVDGDLVGEVTEVLNLPGQDVLSIKSDTGEILIPFVHQLVPIVDIKAKRMTVIPPDIYEGSISK
jgi:16S rRNA processing protein RimM